MFGIFYIFEIERTMERARAIFVDGIGAASATTGVLNQFFPRF